MIPSPMAMHFFIAIRIRVKLEEERGSLNSRERIHERPLVFNPHYLVLRPWGF
jgi:hypothetical protein